MSAPRAIGLSPVVGPAHETSSDVEMVKGASTFASQQVNPQTSCSTRFPGHADGGRVDIDLER